MSSVSYQQCECGIELKIMKMQNECTQTYTCQCKRDIKVSGTILDMHFRQAETAGRDQDWEKVETWRIRG
jgi:hypothetical protein